MLFVCEKDITFANELVITRTNSYIVESVFAVLLRESDNFQCDRATNSTHFLYTLVVYDASASLPHAI